MATELFSDILGDISPTIVFGDNQASIAMVKNPVYHSRSKHIDIRYHYIRDVYANDYIKLVYCPSNLNIADLMTKGIARVQFCKLRQMIGIV